MQSFREWWRDKAFLSEHCKEIEENSRMGKARDLFKKTGDTKGLFHARMGMINDRSRLLSTIFIEVKYSYIKVSTDVTK